MPTRKVRTRDIGNIAVACQRVIFIVSLNDDDDNDNGIPDFRESFPLKDAQGRAVDDDNLRRFDFNLSGAAKVFIAAPVKVPSGETALRDRVRAYEDDKKTAFRFGMRDVPVTMYLEGIKVSATRNDIGFEYQYFNADGSTLCGASALGTVVKVAVDFRVDSAGGAPFSRKNKMLVGGAGAASARVQPPGAIASKWTYDTSGRFVTPTALNSDFEAGNTPTDPARIDKDEVRFTVTSTDAQPAGQAIEAHLPVTLTHPRRLRLTGTKDRERRTTDWINANPGDIDLIDIYFPYEMLDQEGKVLKAESAYAGCKPQARENIGAVLTSPIAALRTWIPTHLRHSPNWRDEMDGKINDHIAVRGISKNLVVQVASGQRLFDPELQRIGGTFMNVAAPDTHIWFIGVKDRSGSVILPVEATHNTFIAAVSDARPPGGIKEIQLTATYVVALGN